MSFIGCSSEVTFSEVTFSEVTFATIKGLTHD